MQRLRRLLRHLDPKASMEETKKAQVLEDIRTTFHVSVPKLRQIQVYMLEEMLLGLSNEEHANLKMLTSFVTKKPTTGANGLVIALDLGGTNFRVLVLELKGGDLVAPPKTKQFQVPQALMTGSGEALFDFIADSIASVVPKGSTGQLGFTFSFPVNQTSLAAGTLIKWTKGFTASGVEGKEVGALLQHAMDKKGLKLTLRALVNDTVGTLITKYFEDNHCDIGVILGTGSNACYWEKIKNIPKFKPGKDLKPEDEMVINMEWGNFDSNRWATPRVLPVTPYDEKVDAASPNKGDQRFEKMLSGMYLGSIVQAVLDHLAEEGILPTSIKRAKFDSAMLSRVLGDATPDLGIIEDMLEKHNAKTTVEERHTIQEICYLVARRAACLAGAAIATIVQKQDRPGATTVSIDGSVFAKVPGFAQTMKETLQELLGPNGVSLVLTKDGSGVGAGLIAALASI